MLFHTFPFLVFFVIVFAVYWSLPRHSWRMLWLLAASSIFYMNWNPWFLLLIVSSASIDYVVALTLERTGSQRLRRTLLSLSIAGNLSFLVYFKYANFFISSVHALLESLGVSFSCPVLSVVLPLGISFYTFEAISYVVDVYRGRIQAVRNPADYALYILFFPHLIAGPIIRPGHFLAQLNRSKHWNWDRMQIGVQLFLIGAFKKAVLADRLAAAVDPVFAEPGTWGTAAVWLGVLAYAAQIYCDFSGYSDMAIGLAHLLGFKLPTNFRAPYLAVGLSDFWKRWHISLSSWVRDYLYIPLGGSHGGRWTTYGNLMVTMFLLGLWHGASWTFTIWGCYNGALLILERAFPLPPSRWPTLRRTLQTVATFLAVCFGLIFVRAQSFGDAGIVLAHLVRPTAGLVLQPDLAIATVAGLVLVFVGQVAGSLVDLPRIERRLTAPALAGFLASLLLITLLLVPETGQPFIYFQF